MVHMSESRTKMIPLFFSLLLLLVLLSGPLSAAGPETTVDGLYDGDFEPNRESNDLPVPLSLGLDLPPLPPEYVIICPDDFKEEVRPLAVHRTVSGLPSAIYTFGSIFDNYTGIDDQQRVHNFLRQLHEEDPHFKWLLIMADSEYLKPRDLWHYAWSMGQPFGDNYSSDVYYAGLDSDWNDDGDDRFGEFISSGMIEADLDWDVFVGRVPASSEQDASNYVNKLIRYEKNPPVGGWMKRFLNWGSLMEPPNRDYDPNRYYDYKSNAYKVCRKVAENISEDIEVLSLYDYPQIEGGNYTPNDGRDTLTRGNMLSAFNKGASMLNFVGQARYEAYALNDYGPPTGTGENYRWNEPLKYSDSDIFTNQDMMPFIYASTCDSAKFFNESSTYNDKSLETWLTSPSGGMVGMISSTGTSARGEERSRSWGNWYLDEQFWKLFLDEGYTRPGSSLFTLKKQYQDRWLDPMNEVKETILGMLYTYILLGDPYVDIYTEIAERFETPSKMGMDLYSGSRMTRFQVIDRSGSPVPNPEVTFYDGKLYLDVRGNKDGWINTSLDLGRPREVNITICGHNMVPYYGKVIIEPAVADISIEKDGLKYYPEDPSPGDLIEFDLKISNLGGEDAEGVQVTVHISGSHGDPSGSLENFQIGQLPARTNLTMEWNWTCRFGLHEFDIEAITSSDDLDPLNQRIEITFDYPGPSFKFFPGTGLINPSSLLPPGVEASVDMDLFNNGTISAPLEIQLFKGDPDEGGTPLSDIMHIGEIGKHRWRNISFAFITPSSTCMIYIVMDPLGSLPPDMVSPPYKTLIEINEPPIWTEAPVLQIMEDGIGWVRLDDKVNDLDGPYEKIDFGINWTGPLDLFIRERGNATEMVCVPGPDVYGSFQVPVQADDGLVSSQITMNISITEVNDPPEAVDASGGKIILASLEDSKMDFTITALDKEGDGISFLSSGLPFEIGENNGTFTWTPLQKDVGSNQFQVEIKDDRGASNVITLQIDVSEVNDPPIVQAIEDVHLNISKELSMKIEAFDEEGSELQYYSNSSLVSIFDNGTLHFNLSEDDIGVFKIRISVFDGLNTVYLDFTIFVEGGSNEDGEGSGVGMNGILMAAIVAAGLFVLIGGGLILFRGTRTDEMVSEEFEFANSIYESDFEPEE